MKEPDRPLSKQEFEAFKAGNRHTRRAIIRGHPQKENHALYQKFKENVRQAKKKRRKERLKTKLQHEKALGTAEKNAREALEALTKFRDGQQQQIASLDAAAGEQKRKDQSEINRLTACLRAGTCGLRVNVNACRAPDPSNVPSAPSGAGLGAGELPELDAAAGSAYLSLREGIAAKERQLEACQGALRTLATGMAR